MGGVLGTKPFSRSISGKGVFYYLFRWAPPTVTKSIVYLYKEDYTVPKYQPDHMIFVLLKLVLESGTLRGRWSLGDIFILPLARSPSGPKIVSPP